MPISEKGRTNTCTDSKQQNSAFSVFAQSKTHFCDTCRVCVVVKIDRDEVLLDIGYKSEGVIPSRELSIRNDVNPAEVVSMGESIEALVLTKEDKEGRLLLSKKRAQYERAWGDIEAKKEAEAVVEGPVIEGEGRTYRRYRASRIPPGLAC